MSERLNKGIGLADVSGCLLISSSWLELFSGLGHYSVCVELMTKVGGGWINCNPIQSEIRMQWEEEEKKEEAQGWLCRVVLRSRTKT